MLKIVKNNIESARQFLFYFPSILISSNWSALSSDGNEMRKELRKFINTAGAGTWPGLHPLRQRVRTSKAGRWIKRTNPMPMKWLAKFARYWLVKKENAVHVSLRDTKETTTELDKSLIGIVRKHELGKKLTLTEEMRDFLSKGIAKAGLSFLRETTKQIKIPKRPIIGPVFSKMRRKIVEHHENKLIKAIRRKEKDYLGRSVSKSFA